MGNPLGTEKISKLVVKIALPAMLAQFVSVLYSIVDRMYVANIPVIGDQALAGVGICGPVVTLISTLAFLVCFGASPLMGISLGEGNQKRAEKIVFNSFLLLLFFSLISIVAIFPLAKPLLYFFGATDDIFPYAESYFRVYVSGTFFALLSLGLNQFIICQGFAKVGMASVLIGAGFNIILDPIFIFLFSMGVEGAAYATIISQFASMVFVLIFLTSKYTRVKIIFTKLDFKLILRILLMGLSPFIILSLDNVMIISINSTIKKWGGDLASSYITANTILQSFMLIVTMPLSGISSGTQGILSYNYGSRDIARVKRAQKYLFLMCIVYTTIMFVAARLFGGAFVSIFTQNEEIYRISKEAIKISTLAIIPLALQYEIIDGFTAMGLVKIALPLSIFRKFIYFASIFILPVFYGIESIFYAEPISDVLGPLLSVTIYVCIINRVLRKRQNSLKVQNI